MRTQPFFTDLFHDYSEGDLISQNQQCGDGWVQRKSSNSCYFWDTNNLQTYAGAVQECNLMGADLLVINDDDEQVRIVQVLCRTCFARAVYV